MSDPESEVNIFAPDSILGWGLSKINIGPLYRSVWTRDLTHPIVLLPFWFGRLCILDERFLRSEGVLEVGPTTFTEDTLHIARYVELGWGLHSSIYYQASHIPNGEQSLSADDTDSRTTSSAKIESRPSREILELTPTPFDIRETRKASEVAMD